MTSIIKNATISVRDTNLKVHYELSAIATFEKRSKSHKIPNNSKFKNQIDYPPLMRPSTILGFISQIEKNIVTVSTKAFYSYVHQGRTSIKPIDLPRMVRRKTKNTTY